ncbi:hypothetical protein CANCADRAFT_13822, partial [Tortispora caseinolytica NRRL Y-17796]
VALDVDLPNVSTRPKGLLAFLGFVVFCAVIGAGIINNDNLNSNIVGSALYSLRRSPTAREALGSKIQLKGAFPWLWGSLNIVHGDVHFQVPIKGDKNSGILRFRATRQSPNEEFKLLEWSIEV